MWVMPISIASPLRTVVPSELLRSLLLEFLDPFREGWKNLARYFPEIGIVAGWWWLEHDEHMTFQKQLGMSSSQVTFIIIFLRGVGRKTTNQVDISWYIQWYPESQSAISIQKRETHGIWIPLVFIGIHPAGWELSDVEWQPGYPGKRLQFVIENGWKWQFMIDLPRKNGDFP